MFKTWKYDIYVLKFQFIKEYLKNTLEKDMNRNISISSKLIFRIKKIQRKQNYISNLINHNSFMFPNSW